MALVHCIAAAIVHNVANKQIHALPELFFCVQRRAYFNDRGCSIIVERVELPILQIVLPFRNSLKYHTVAVHRTTEPRTLQQLRRGGDGGGGGGGGGDGDDNESVGSKCGKV